MSMVVNYGLKKKLFGYSRVKGILVILQLLGMGCSYELNKLVLFSLWVFVCGLWFIIQFGFGLLVNVKVLVLLCNCLLSYSNKSELIKFSV